MVEIGSRQRRSCHRFVLTIGQCGLFPSGWRSLGSANHCTVSRNLRECKVVHRAWGGLPGSVPLNQPLQRSLKSKTRSPREITARTTGVEPEIADLVRAVILIKHPRCSIPPEV